MKIAALGQKKNSDLIDPFEENYALPDLDAPRPQVVVTPQPVVAPKVEQPTVVPAPTPQPTPVQVPAVEVQPAQPVVKEVAQPEPQPVAAPAPTPTLKVSGISQLKGSLIGLLKEVADPVESEGKGIQIVIDPESESKMLNVKDDIIKKMCADRPRFVSAFENIAFDGNVVRLAVPSEALKDELIGERFWILKAIAEMAKVNGSLDMKIEIKEMDFKLKPIKLEDRVEHIRKVLPEFDYMQKVFDMDVE